ncbi:MULTISPECIES: YlbG family protein [Exiguobacterium]|uniref:YlbG family protein n=1 Tax=Exiguobacterium TaxID=33986 RepID=UPI0021AF693E|nr:YlbG family protein [Exiguobacterium himgiriensis]MCT4783737.1 YlbG family protein [Exiguobacterium himgiriensis]
MDVLSNSFERNGRIGLVVYVQSLKQVKVLRRYANLYYVSKREKYAFLYTDLEGHETVIEQMQALPFVENVIRSERPFIAETYEPKQK